MAGMTGAGRTMTEVLARALAAHPDRPWIVTDDGPVSYRALDGLSNALARGMAGAGLRTGDRLLVMLPDIVESVAVWLACCKLRVVDVPVNTAYRGDILAHVANDSGAETAIVAGAFLDRVAIVADRLPTLRRCFVLGQHDAPDGIGSAEVLPFAALPHADGSPIDAAPPRERDLMSIMYTSGTTGASKGVMVAHAFEYAEGCATALGLTGDDVYHTAGLPLFHVAGRWGVVLASAIRGAVAVVPRRFSASAFWNEVRENGATATYLLGAMANFLQRQPLSEHDADNPMRKVLMCPLLPDVAAFARRFDLAVATAYGSTEVNAPILMPLGAPVRDNAVVGQPRADRFEVMIADENDVPVPPGVLGEILVRPLEPWTTMLGYWNQPELTARMWRNLWLHSGDAGRRDEDGTLYFVDRIKDTIRRRGENISSMEVEGIVNQHDAVLECAVFPVPSEHTEDEVMAAVVVRPDARLAPDELIRFLEPRMPHFMLPRFVDIVEDLPKTPTGKVTKQPLRQGGVSGRTWDREAERRGRADSGKDEARPGRAPQPGQEERST